MAADVGTLPATSSTGRKFGISPFSVGLLITLATAGLVLYVATLPRAAMSPPQAIQTEKVNSSSDLYAAVQYVKQIGAEYTSATNSKVTLKILPLVPVGPVDAEILAPNGTFIQVMGEPDFTDEDGWRSWTWPISVHHTGHIGDSTQDLEMRIRYVVASPEGQTEVKMQTIPVNMTVRMLDFPQLFYIGMITIGIIASYVSAEGGKIRSRIVGNFGEIRRPLVWILLSLILTPSVYVQFKELAGVLTDNQALISLLLALPFGAGLDFALGKAAVGRS